MISKLKIKTEICNDVSHGHKSPIQKMIGFFFKGHHVEVTQDGDEFNARIDERGGRYGLSKQALIDFLRSHLEV